MRNTLTHVVNETEPTVLAVVMLVLGIGCLWRPDIVQSYSIWSLQVGRGSPPRSTLEFVKSRRYPVFLRAFSILPLSAGVFVTWMLLKR